MVYGVGYCSEKKERYSDTNNKCFLTWRNMLKRCYSEEKKYDNYRELGVTVCEEWLDYSVFKKWFERNYYEVPNENMQLDKDILSSGNKIYSPESCIFVPEKINRLYIKDRRHRGELPIGVSLEKRSGNYIASCSIRGENVRTKHNNADEAFMSYKKMKEEYVRECAEEYKNFIPERLYNSMMMFEVKMTD